VRVPSLPLTAILAAAVSLAAAPAVSAQSPSASPNAASSPGAATPPCATSPGAAPSAAPSAPASPSVAPSTAPSASASPGATAPPVLATPLVLTRSQVKVKGDARASAVAVGADGLIVITTEPQYLPSSVASQIWTTTDGTTFKAAKLPAGKGSAVLSVVATSDGFVAVGIGETPSMGLVWTSADGHTWKLTHKVPGVQFVTVIPTPTGVLIGGGIPRADLAVEPGFWSLDPRGEPVAIHVDGNGNVAHLVSIPGGGWLAAGQESVKQADGTFKGLPHLWSSSDCTTWTPVVVPGAATWISMLASAAGVLFMTTIENGSDGKPVFHLWSSLDGVAWQDALQSTDAGVASLVAVAGGVNGFRTGGQVISTDLTTWQQSADLSLEKAWPAAAVTTPDGQFVVVGATTEPPFHPLVWTARPEPPAP
jgi:hypothetical protein